MDDVGNHSELVKLVNWVDDRVGIVVGEMKQVGELEWRVGMIESREPVGDDVVLARDVANDKIEGL